MDALWADGEIPHLTTEQMVEVDRSMIEDFGIDLPRMMENAGHNLAHLARERFLDGNADGKRIAVLAGRGGNGGVRWSQRGGSTATEHWSRSIWPAAQRK